MAWLKATRFIMVRISLLTSMVVAPSLWISQIKADEKSPSVRIEQETALPTTVEARARAQLLHAAIHGSLRIMHRDFFHQGDSKAIPSESLKDVFKAMEEEWHVTIRWLASDETVMNVDNKAKDDFQRKALVAVKSGEKEMTAVENGTFRFAGVIPLQNQCLKCHSPDRTSLEDRFAALEISMRVRPPGESK